MARQKYRSCLHNDTKYILKTAQIFGLFPVFNLLSDKYGGVRFKWISFYTLYSLLLMAATVMFTLLTFLQLCSFEFRLHFMDSFMFCFSASFISLAFFKLSMDWPDLLTNFCKAELSFRNYYYQKNSRRQFTFIFIITTTGIIVEHILAMANTYFGMNHQLIVTSNNTHLQLYFKSEYPFVFDHMEYSNPVAFFLFAINNCNVFAWNFIDAFIMMMSSALAFRFKQICLQIETGTQKKHIPILFWTKIREDYSVATELCQKVNEKIGHMIVISFGTNMYFVLTQLYKGLTVKRAIIDPSYFVFSFVFMIVRLTGVILCGSAVHIESRKPLRHLVSLKSKYYNSEVERFILQIHCHDVSLSGNQFFDITRGLIFGMATTIITYELFMLQTRIK